MAEEADPVRAPTMSVSRWKPCPKSHATAKSACQRGAVACHLVGGPRRHPVDAHLPPRRDAEEDDQDRGADRPRRVDPFGPEPASGPGRATTPLRA